MPIAFINGEHYDIDELQARAARADELEDEVESLKAELSRLKGENEETVH